MRITNPALSATAQPRQQLAITANQNVNWSISSGLGQLSTVGPSLNVVYTPPDPMTPGQSATVEAVDPSNASNTASLTINFASPAFGLSPVSPSSGYGFSSAFSFSATDSNPAGIGGTQDVSINFAFVTAATSVSSLHMSDACGGAYQPSPSNLVFLWDDSVGQFRSQALGNGSLSNPQCTLMLAGATGGVNDSVVSLNLPSITFASAFVGTKDIDEAIFDSSFMLGYSRIGQWAVVPFSLGGVNPLNGTASAGETTHFTFSGTDILGLNNAYLYLLFSPQTAAQDPPASACYLQYQVQTNSLFLADDNGAFTIAPVLAGGTLSNSQCSVKFESSSSASNTTDVTTSITFNASFIGTKAVFMNLFDAGTGTQLFPQPEGTWTVQ